MTTQAWRALRVARPASWRLVWGVSRPRNWRRWVAATGRGASGDDAARAHDGRRRTGLITALRCAGHHDGQRTTPGRCTPTPARPPGQASPTRVRAPTRTSAPRGRPGRPHGAPTLLVQCRHRLGHPLAAARGHLAVPGPSGPPPAAPTPPGRRRCSPRPPPGPPASGPAPHRHAGPALRRQAARVVREDPGRRRPTPDGDDAGLVRVLTRRDRGIDRCHHPHQVRHLREAHPEAGASN